jgi:hypothetical protein
MRSHLPGQSCGRRHYMSKREDIYSVLLHIQGRMDEGKKNVPVKIRANLVRSTGLEGVALSAASLEKTGTLASISYKPQEQAS